MKSCNFFLRFSDSKSKSVLYWSEYLLGLEVTWLSLIGVASSVRTKREMT